MNRGQALTFSLPLIVFVLTACNTSTSEPPHDRLSATGVKPVVNMELIQFKPETIEVSPGERVTWIQRDAGFHTVTSGLVEQGAGGVTPRADGKFDSGELGTDREFTYAFSSTGTYPYFCSIHPATMRGEVRVVQGG